MQLARVISFYALAACGGSAIVLASAEVGAKAAGHELGLGPIIGLSILAGLISFIVWLGTDE